MQDKKIKMKINKILIFGGCGHGKTCLGKNVSDLLNIPTYDLDNVTFNEEHSKKVSDSLRDKRLNNILKKQRWIIEGPYAGEWIYPAIKKSEIIVILKINSLIATKRVISRFIKEKMKRVKNKGRTLKDLPRIMKYAFGYTYDYFPKHIDLAKTFNKEFIILKNKKQINRFLEDLK